MPNTKAAVHVTTATDDKPAMQTSISAPPGANASRGNAVLT